MCGISIDAPNTLLKHTDYRSTRWICFFGNVWIESYGVDDFELSQLAVQPTSGSYGKWFIWNVALLV